MPNIMRLPTSGVVLAVDDARALADALFSAHDLAGRHGAGLNPRLLVLASELSSVSGEKEPPPIPIEHTVKYEQIDTDTAAEIVGCSPRNIRDLATRGRLPGIKRAGLWWFNREDVETYRDYR